MFNQGRTNMFDELIKFTGGFVELQKGACDYLGWLKFVTGLQRLGIDATEEMQNYIGQVLERMQKLYITSLDNRGIGNSMLEASLFMVKFMERTRGSWDMRDVEHFICELEKMGIDMTDETQKYLVGVMEAVTEVYASFFGLKG